LLPNLARLGGGHLSANKRANAKDSQPGKFNQSHRSSNAKVPNAVHFATGGPSEKYFESTQFVDTGWVNLIDHRATNCVDCAGSAGTAAAHQHVRKTQTRSRMFQI